MSSTFNKTYFSCIESTDNNSVHIINRCDTYIGYGPKGGLYAIRVLSIISLILNFFFLIFQFIRIKGKKIKNKRKTTMRILFQIIPIFDCIISIYWIISSFTFSQAIDIKNNSNFCIVLSTFYQCCFTFEFIMINCILFHFKNINLSPMDGILKPYRNLFLYIIASLVVSLIVGIISLFTNIGRSPMNTCFINTIYTDWYGLFFIIPFIFLFTAIGQILLDLCCKNMFITDKGIRKLYKINSIYVLIFCFLHIPFLIFFIHTTMKGEELIDMDEDSFQIYSFIITFFTSIIPLIIGLLKYFQGLTKIECINDLCKKNKITRKRKIKKLEMNNSIKRELSVRLSEVTDPFEWLEKHVMENFMRDILIGISTCLEKSKKYGNEINLEEGDDSMSYEKYNINLHSLKYLKFRDETINNCDYLDIDIVNYAPKCFALLRQLEKIDIDEMIDSFLPKNNSQGLKKSQGKSGSFFISTDDNKYMVKSLKSDEIDLIRNGFLSKYIKHIEKTKNESLLCRLYGMYNIITGQGKEFLIIVMRNVIGDFKDNVVVKFDLKGSTYKRRAKFDMDNTNNNVMKDLNFNEIERNIMISKNSIEKLRNIVKQDSKFLCRSELMDYSLFLIKLTLNKEEAIDLFGKNIKQNQKKAVIELSHLEISNNDSFKIDEIEENNSGKGKMKDIRYYRQYLFPSLREGYGYIIVIIDYFQYFNFFKVMEANVISKFKTGFNKKNNNTISCVNPVIYSKRFIDYFFKLTNLSEIKELNENNNMENIEEIDEENNNIDSETEENLINKNKNLINKNGNILETDSSEINIDLNDKEDIQFNLRITINEKNMKKTNQFLQKNKTYIKKKKKHKK